MNDVLETIKKYCLRVYENGYEFQKAIEQQKLTNWFIEDGRIEDRLNRVKQNKYFVALKEEAEQTNTKASDAEILTWLDTMNFMYWTLHKILNNIQGSIDFTIIQELRIPYSNKRPDYLLIADNKILVIEFSYNNQSNDSNYRFESKLTQAVCYKEMLSSILPQHIKIGTYTCLIKPERGKFQDFTKQSYYNEREELVTFDDQVNLAFYIQEYFVTYRQKTAIEELSYKLFDRKTGE